MWACEFPEAVKRSRRPPGVWEDRGFESCWSTFHHYGHIQYPICLFDAHVRKPIFLHLQLVNLLTLSVIGPTIALKG